MVAADAVDARVMVAGLDGLAGRAIDGKRCSPGNGIDSDRTRCARGRARQLRPSALDQLARSRYLVSSTPVDKFPKDDAAIIDDDAEGSWFDVMIESWRGHS